MIILGPRFVRQGEPASSVSPADRLARMGMLTAQGAPSAYELGVDAGIVAVVADKCYIGC